MVTEALSLTKRSLPRRSMGHSDITKMEHMKIRLQIGKARTGYSWNYMEFPRPS